MSSKPAYKLLNTWVKSPVLKGADLLIASACLPSINEELFQEISEGKVVLLACPEEESPIHYGKIATIIRSSQPRTVTVVTIEGSPHCFTLHASVNLAEYLLGTKLSKKHYVVVDGEELVEISDNAVRLARYLSIVNKVLKQHPELLDELGKHSLEYALLQKARS